MVVYEVYEEVYENERPAIIVWNVGGIQHFVTIVGFNPVTTDICIMNSEGPGAIEGGHWCAPWDDIEGGNPGDDWEWEKSYTIQEDRAENTLLQLWNAPELPAGSVYGPTPQDHEDIWGYYLGDGEEYIIGPYVIASGAFVTIVNYSNPSVSNNRITLKPGFHAKAGSDVLVTVVE